MMVGRYRVNAPRVSARVDEFVAETRGHSETARYSTARSSGGDTSSRFVENAAERRIGQPLINKSGLRRNHIKG
jgi:hypothetical protein